MRKILQYYVDVLSTYHNLPQMDEYLKFHGLTQEDVIAFLEGKFMDKPS